MTTQVCARKDDHELRSQCCFAGPFNEDEVDTAEQPAGFCAHCHDHTMFDFVHRACEAFCLSCNEGEPPDPEIVCECDEKARAAEFFERRFRNRLLPWAYRQDRGW